MPPFLICHAAMMICLRTKIQFRLVTIGPCSWTSSLSWVESVYLDRAWISLWREREVHRSLKHRPMRLQLWSASWSHWAPSSKVPWNGLQRLAIITICFLCLLCFFSYFWSFFLYIQGKKCLCPDFSLNLMSISICLYSVVGKEQEERSCCCCGEDQGW